MDGGQTNLRLSISLGLEKVRPVLVSQVFSEGLMGNTMGNYKTMRVMAQKKEERDETKLGGRQKNKKGERDEG